jgi:putative transposase
MKASEFTDAQKAFIIRQGEDGIPVAEICRKAGISQATYFNWKKKYAGLMPSEMKRLRELEEENRGGSVCLNRYRSLDKWIPALRVMPQPGLVAAR